MKLKNAFYWAADTVVYIDTLVIRKKGCSVFDEIIFEHFILPDERDHCGLDKASQVHKIRVSYRIPDTSEYFKEVFPFEPEKYITNIYLLPGLHPDEDGWTFDMNSISGLKHVNSELTEAIKRFEEDGVYEA